MTTAIPTLDAYTRPGTLYRRLDDDSLQCYACGIRCVIKHGKRGVCQVRFNRGGELYVPWGYVSAAHVDPVEKKPFFHLLPGSRALTFGMLGCNYHCGFCQNWVTSQVARDPDAAALGGLQTLQPVDASALAETAVRSGAPLVVSSYNEPLITSEWAMEVFAAARERGLRCAYVSNGNATPEVLQALQPYLTGFKVDLKSMQQSHYRSLGGSLKTVLATIEQARGLGMWVEVVTLVIPGFNDSQEELEEMARFLVSVSPDIPWHLTAFHPDYQMTDPDPTPAATLVRASEIGRSAGLRYVYAGNLPGRVGTLEDTFCPGCETLLVQRRGMRMIANRITAEGKCPQCGTEIPGVWA